LSQDKLALHHYSLANKADPDYPLAYHHSGTIFLKNKEYRKAERSFQKAIELAPDFPWPYTKLGFTYLEQENYNKAEEYFKKALELDPEEYWAYLGLADVARKRGDVDAQLSYSLKAKELAEEDSDVRNYLGIAYECKKDYLAAIAEYERALELDPYNRSAANNLGFLYEKLMEETQSQEFKEEGDKSLATTAPHLQRHLPIDRGGDQPPEEAGSGRGNHRKMIKHLNTPAIAFRVERADERGYYLAHLRRKPLKERKDKDASGSPIINGLKGSFTGDSLIIWGIGGGATLAVYPADDSIREYVIRTSPLGDPCQGISDWGERVAIFSFIPFLAIGGCGGKPRELKVAYALIEAHLLAGAITQGLKFGIGRERPDGGDHSFPSGHTSASFTFASVIAEFYGVKGGIPAYLLASLVALSPC